MKDNSLPAPHPDHVRFVGSARLLGDPDELDRHSEAFPWASTRDITPDDRHRLKVLLARLAPRDRQILSLYYLEELDQKGIASRLNITEASASEAIARALLRAQALGSLPTWTPGQVRVVLRRLGLAEDDVTIIVEWWITPSYSTVAERLGLTWDTVRGARTRFLRRTAEIRQMASEAGAIEQALSVLAREQGRGKRRRVRREAKRR